jgi:uroporphyrin-3 C-methyltransferase
MSNQEETGISPIQSDHAPGWKKYVNTATVIGAVAVMLLAAQWLDTRHRVNALEQELGKRLATSDSKVTEGRTIAAKTQEETRTALVKLGLLESKLVESQNQQVALEALYQELSRNRDESTLAEIEQILMIASQQLQLAGNIKAALLALQTADARLQRMEKPQFIGLRKIINKDIERLKIAPAVDMADISLKLDGLIADNSRPEKVVADSSVWARLGHETLREIKQLVQVRRIDKPEAVLLTPSQTYFLRENLKLRLLTARIALLQRDGASYKADLQAAQEWLNAYFNSQDKSVKQALTTLRRLAGNSISIEMPDITASLNAVRDRKLARERN